MITATLLFTLLCAYILGTSLGVVLVSSGIRFLREKLGRCPVCGRRKSDSAPVVYAPNSVVTCWGQHKQAG